MHIPKCAGSALYRSIRECLDISGLTLDETILRTALHASTPDEIAAGMKNLCAEWFPQSVALFAYHIAQDVTLLRAHLPVSRRLLDEQLTSRTFVTVLRDPVERWISNYRFDKVRNTNPSRQPWRDNPQPIVNEMRTVMHSQRGRELGRIYTWMLGGIEATGRIDSSEAVELAKENLSRFTVLGIAEDLTSLTPQLKRIYGREVVFTRRRNTTDSMERDERVDYDVLREVNDEIRDELRLLCAQDMEIYRHCRQELATRLPRKDC